MGDGWAPTLRERLIGSWELLEIDGPGRGAAPFGERPVGRIRFTEAGEMSMQIMATDRRRLASLDEATPEELRATLGGYLACFGRFEVDAASRTVSHVAIGSLSPAHTGRTFRRRVLRLDDRHLDLAGFDELGDAGADVSARWLRLDGR